MGKEEIWGQEERKVTFGNVKLRCLVDIHMERIDPQAIELRREELMDEARTGDRYMSVKAFKVTRQDALIRLERVDAEEKSPGTRSYGTAVYTVMGIKGLEEGE